MDVFSPEKRSDIMRHVKSSGNRSTEERMITFFKEHSIKGWQRNYKIYGKPDFVFREQKTAVFLDGCFWHGHDCRNTRPSQNAEYWQKKRAKNMARDADVTAHLEKLGWAVIRIWECELKKKNQSALWERLQPFFQ
jgi:DNA mismatch endonuclease, patch repair protein